MTGHLPDRPARPMVSLVAAAKRITAGRVARGGRTSRGQEAWQSDAWDAYDLVGELRYTANHIGRALSRARLVAAIDPRGAADPEVIDLDVADDDPDGDGPNEVSRLAADLVADLGGSAAGQSQMLQRLGVHLFVGGESYIVGMELPDDDGDVRRVWFAASPDEVNVKDGRLTVDHGDGKKVEADLDASFLTRVWQPHPRRWWLADSPTRSALPVLHELIALTAHIDATVESRLAGAGLLVLPNSVTMAGGGNSDEMEDDEDPFVEALIETMVTPIKDRDSAAAVVPLVVRVPDETVGSIQHLTFSTPLDAAAKDLRDEALRRLALSLDVEPSILLGAADLNHWSLWAVSEGTVTTHVEPVLSLIADALTVGYLRPALEAAGVPVEVAAEYVVWFDTANLVLRPNRNADAQTAHAAGVISDAALRAALGFDESDAPVTEGQSVRDRAVEVVFDLVRAAPSLAQDPGLPSLVEQVIGVLEGDADAVIEAEPEPAPATGDGVADGLPQTNGDVGLAASGRRFPDR